MKLFFSNILTLAVYNYSKELDGVARTLGMILEGVDDDAEADFISGYKNYDSKKVNELLEKGLTQALGSDRYSYELEKYLRKFGIEEELSLKSDRELLRIVSGHRDEIKKILAQKGIS